VADISCKTKDYTNYVRLERKSYPSIYSERPDFSRGFTILKKSAENYIISTGPMAHVALAAADRLKEKGIDIGVIDMFTIPINEKEFVSVVKNAKKLVTLEEHFMAGGLGSAVCEVLADNSLLLPVKRLAVPMDKGYNYVYGGRDVIREYLGIDEDSAVRRIAEFIK